MSKSEQVCNDSNHNPSDGVPEPESSNSNEPAPHESENDEKSKLEELSFNPIIIERLCKLFKNKSLSSNKQVKVSLQDLDSRALDALKNYSCIEGLLNILDEFEAADLDHVSNKSAYLCTLMKSQKSKEKAAKRNVSGSSVSSVSSSSPNHRPSAESIKSNEGKTTGPFKTHHPGPDSAVLQQILDRTHYSLDVTSGQRKYGGPPPEAQENFVPGVGCELFVGKIPKEVFEDKLILLFEPIGRIWDLRLMIDPLTGYNRGYAFITYCNKEDALTAQQKFDGYEIETGKKLKVNISVPNLRLFVGNIPKSKSRDEIFNEFSKITAGLVQVIVYSSPDDQKKNRGFCFLEYDAHKSASLARRKLITGRSTKVWGCDILVDWADPQEEPDDETMDRVKVLYVRNLTADVTEEQLKELFVRKAINAPEDTDASDDVASEAIASSSVIERVKKIKDYAFIHFVDRDHAVKAMEELNNYELNGIKISVSLAKPPSDKKKKEEILRARERRVQQMMQQRHGDGFTPDQAMMAALNMPHLPALPVPLAHHLPPTLPTSLIPFQPPMNASFTNNTRQHQNRRTPHQNHAPSPHRPYYAPSLHDVYAFYSQPNALTFAPYWMGQTDQRVAGPLQLTPTGQQPFIRAPSNHVHQPHHLQQAYSQATIHNHLNATQFIPGGVRHPRTLWAPTANGNPVPDVSLQHVPNGPMNVQSLGSQKNLSNNNRSNRNNQGKNINRT